MSQSDSTRKQGEQLAQVQALSHEIASAISAIEKNDFRQFESHLAAQEALCNRIVAANRMLPPAPADAERGEKDLDPSSELLAEIRQAHIALAQLNKVYAAVLKRAERTAGLIAALYHSQGHGYERSPSRATKHHTWSCEV